MVVFAFEKILLSTTQGVGAAWLDPVMLMFSGTLIWIPFVFLALWGVSRNRSTRETLILLTFAFLLVAVVDSSTSSFFKNIFQRLRPCKIKEFHNVIRDFGQGCGGRWGFFSSHSANAAALASFLMPFLPSQQKWRLGTWTFVFLVAFSRLYLGVHFPLDLIAGIFWGMLLAWPWRRLAKNALAKVPTSP